MQTLKQTMAKPQQSDDSDRIAAIKEAMNDPMFIADLNEVMEDFGMWILRFQLGIKHQTF